MVVWLFCDEAQNYKMGIFVTLFLANLYQQRFFSFIETRKRQSKESSTADFCVYLCQFLYTFLLKFYLCQFFFFHRKQEVIIMSVSPELVPMYIYACLFYLLVTDFCIQDATERWTIKFRLLSGIFKIGKYNILARFKENLTA